MSEAALKLIFMGSPEFAVPTLQTLIDSSHEIVAVYTQPPRPARRGKQEQRTAIHQLAEQYELPVYTPTSLKDKDTQNSFAAHQPDAAIVAAYGLILPDAILKAPRLGCLNVHPSRLPRWRGAAPLQRTVMAGDEDTALCIMQMDSGLDTGAILLQEDYALEERMTAGELHDLMAEEAGSKLLEALEGLHKGSITAKTQPETGITYAEKISKSEAELDWSLPAEILHFKILGLSPFPGAWFHYKGERIKVLRSDLAHRMSFAKPGCTVNDHLSVTCGDGGVLRLLELQRPGKKPMLRDEFLRGFPIAKGTLL